MTTTDTQMWGFVTKLTDAQTPMQGLTAYGAKRCAADVPARDVAAEIAAEERTQRSYPTGGITVRLGRRNPGDDPVTRPEDETFTFTDDEPRPAAQQ
ncbi:hypothetical protein [Streptomyces sp. NPDC049879]|uniref:hypothetical protein n=1 Tax=Streptomyces sp. NPDC049879 TaxID=3365598 RepID=UPI0037974859